MVHSEFYDISFIKDDKDPFEFIGIVSIYKYPTNMTREAFYDYLSMIFLINGVSRAEIRKGS
jgi:hypothetical protein